MKNLDDLLRAKSAQIETKEAEEVQAIEQEVRQNIENDLSKLTDTKKQLEFVRESLSIETGGRIKAQRDREQAEMKIDVKATDLEKVGLSKEELLNNPDYQELEEVKAVADTSAEVEMYSTPSVGSAELTKKLTGLGVELPESETNDEVVEKAIEARLQELDNSILETRLKIPEERESLVREIIATHKIKLDKVDLRRDVPSYDTKGSFKDVSEQLEGQIRNIPIAENNPELKKEIMEAVVTEALLSQSKEYQEQVKKQAEHKTKVDTYEAVKEKLPAYIETLNTEFFNPIHERLAELDRGIARDILEDREFKPILDRYTLEGQWLNNEKPRKITGLDLPEGAKPSVAQMDKHLNEKPWDAYEFKNVLEKLEALKEISYGDFGRNNRQGIFQGYLNEVSGKLAPQETVPRAERFSDEAYQEWDRGFAEVENRARDQASRLTTYGTFKEEFGKNDIRDVESENKKIDEETFRLKKAQQELHNSSSSDQFRFEGDKIVNVTWEERNNKDRDRLIALDAEILQIDESLTSLGQRPAGIFSKKKGEEWDIKKMRLESDKKRKLGEKEGTNNNIKNFSEDWTSKINLPKDITKNFDGQTVAVGVVNSVIYNKIDELGEIQRPLQDLIRKRDYADSKLLELEKSRFYFDDSSSYFPSYRI